VPNVTFLSSALAKRASGKTGELLAVQQAIAPWLWLDVSLIVTTSAVTHSNILFLWMDALRWRMSKRYTWSRLQDLGQKTVTCFFICKVHQQKPCFVLLVCPERTKASR